MKSGFIAVVGRANAGKSTLVNVLVGEKVAIVSPKPQTTRDRILGVLTTENYQIAFIDTPGIYKADNLLNSVMQKTTADSTADVDLVLFVMDAHEGISDTDRTLLKKYASLKVPTVLALTKTDIMTESLLISELKELGEFGIDIVPVSARKGRNIKELLKVLVDKLPNGEKIFEQDIVSDRSEKFMVSEIMREKILLKFDKEIPHGVAIIVNQFELAKGGNMYEISLDIVCEKPNHKAILIGKTTLDELAMGGTGTSGHLGITYNPYDAKKERLCGGSSCGSAAGVSSCITPFSIGSDTGDSVRKPASFNGLVGIKPTWGRISRYGLFSFANSLDHVAYFTRSVEDSAIILNALAGRDDRDMTSSYEKVENYVDFLPTKGSKIAVIKEIIDSVHDEFYVKKFYEFINNLKAQGYVVDLVSMDEKLLRAVLPVYFVISCAEAGSNNANLDGIKFGVRKDGNSYDEIMKNSRSEGFGELIKRRFISYNDGRVKRRIYSKMH